MTIKFSIAVLLGIGSITIAALSMKHQPELKLTVKGNDELGVKLELPYLKESPADVIITNYGRHNVLAYKIRWESIKFNGEVVERQYVGYHPEALIEKDLKKRKELLVAAPLLPPHSKWLTGIGRDTLRITRDVPTLEQIGRDPELFPDLKEYKQINVTLDAVILENGQVVGRDPAAFETEIDAAVADYRNFAKDPDKYIKDLQK